MTDPVAGQSEILLASLSRLLGWTYFLLWSLSFYPQVLLNQRLRSVRGLSADFTLLNLLGHVCYAVYNLAFLLSGEVQRQYRQRYGSDPVVRWNDAAFATHAAILSGITAIQWMRFRHNHQAEQPDPLDPPASPTEPTTSNGEPAVPSDPHPHSPHHDGTSLTAPTRLALLVLLTVLVASLGLLNIGTLPALTFLTLLAYLKLAVTTVKYLPQIVLNHQRSSTRGFSIENILLDASGGVLSLAQLVLDCARVRDWSGITGDIGKLGLSLLSILYDLILIFQHFVLYRSSAVQLDHDEPRESDRGVFSSLFASTDRRTAQRQRSARDAERGTERQRLLDPSEPSS